MRGLIKFALGKTVFLNIVFIGVVVYGLWALFYRMPVDRYPNIQFGEVVINTAYPGASAEDVEKLVTQEIEDSLRGMADVDYVRSTSRGGLSIVKVKLVDDTDYDTLIREVKVRVASVQNRLPTLDGKILAPTVTEIDVDEWLPVIQVNLIGADPAHPLDIRALTLLAKEMQTRLETIDGIKKVPLLGDRSQQFSVAIDPDLLQRHGVTFAEVAQALRDSGNSLPAGTLATDNGERLIRLDTRYRSRDDLLQVVVKRDGDGNFLTVGDLLDHVATGVRDVKDSVISHVNGQDAVSCKVIKVASADSRRIKAAVEEEVASFMKAHADDGVAVVYSTDSTIQIDDSIGVLMVSLLFGGVLVGSTLLIFLNFRAGVVTVWGVTFAFIGSLAWFQLTGISLNEVSLLGFVLVVGIIVDDAIIVLENIQRHREQGEALVPAVVEATSEVFWPVFSATLTSCASFLPLLLMTGAVGDFFALIPIAVTTALAFSLIECLIMLPGHVVDLERVIGPAKLKNQTATTAMLDERAFTGRPGFIGRLHRLYDRLLKWNLSHPFLTVLFVFVLFCGAIGVLVQSSVAPLHGQTPLLRFKFFPDDTTQLAIRVNMPSGTPLPETDRLVRAIAANLMQRGPGVVTTVSSFAGMTVNTDYEPEFGNQSGVLVAQVASAGQRTFAGAGALISQLRNDFAEDFADSGALIEVEAQQGGPPSGLPVNVRITGVEETVVRQLADDLLAWMQQEARYQATIPAGKPVPEAYRAYQDPDDPQQLQNLAHHQIMALQYGEQAIAGIQVVAGRLAGVTTLKHDQDQIKHVVAFRPDQDELAQMGIGELRVFDYLAGAFDGAYVGDYRRSDKDIPVRLTFPAAITRDPVRILNLPIVDDAAGRVIRFADVGGISTHTEPAALVRRDFQRTVTITGDLAEEATLAAGNVVDIVRKWYAEHLERYPGATIAFGGEAESTSKSYTSLYLAMFLAVFLIYLILATQFNSYGQPLLIMSNIVFSFTGVILVMGGTGALLMLIPEGWVQPERTWFTVDSFIAIIGLTGLVVNDAIVLIDFINQRLRDGLPLRQALLMAGHQRMRPIFMTTITTIAGLLPMAVGLPRFSITWTPFATCFVSGLFMSTAMTLLVVPVLFELYAKHFLHLFGVHVYHDESATWPRRSRSYEEPAEADA